MVHFERYRTSLAPKLTAPNGVHSEKFSVLFRSFLQQLKAKNPFMIALLQTLQLAFLESARQAVVSTENIFCQCNLLT